MNNNKLFVGIAIGALAVDLIFLLSGDWGGMMRPWGMMGPWMMAGWTGFNPIGWIVNFIVLFLLGVFLATLAIWVANSGKKK